MELVGWDGVPNQHDLDQLTDLCVLAVTGHGCTDHTPNSS